MPTPTAGYLMYAKVSLSASPTVKMSGLTDLSLPINTALYDVTNADAGSTNGYTQVIPGLTGLKVTFKVNYDPTDASQTILRNAVISKALVYIIASENGTNTATFSGYVDSFQSHAPVNNKADATITMTVSGAITLA